MTSSGKIRIYELSKDLSLDNKDVLDAARKLAIPAKSHSSSISSLEANQIKDLLRKSNNVNASKKPSKTLEKEILSLKKNPPKTQKNLKSESKENSPSQSANLTSKLNVPLKPNQNLVKSKEPIRSSNQKVLKNKAPVQNHITSPSAPTE